MSFDEKLRNDQWTPVQGPGIFVKIRDMTDKSIFYDKDATSKGVI